MGVDPAPVRLDFVPGPPTAASAEQTALAMIRTCGATAWRPGAVDLASLTSTVESGVGERSGPNDGRDVWLVRVDGRTADGDVEVHYLVEVSRDTGIPTLVGVG